MFEATNVADIFYTDFPELCPDFCQIKTFRSALAPPALPPSTPLVGGHSSLDFGASNV